MSTEQDEVSRAIGALSGRVGGIEQRVRMLKNRLDARDAEFKALQASNAEVLARSDQTLARSDQTIARIDQTIARSDQSHALNVKALALAEKARRGEPLSSEDIAFANEILQRKRTTTATLAGPPSEDKVEDDLDAVSAQVNAVRAQVGGLEKKVPVIEGRVAAQGQELGELGTIVSEQDAQLAGQGRIIKEMSEDNAVVLRKSHEASERSDRALERLAGLGIVLPPAPAEPQPVPAPPTPSPDDAASSSSGAEGELGLTSESSVSEGNDARAKTQSEAETDAVVDEGLKEILRELDNQIYVSLWNSLLFRRHTPKSLMTAHCNAGELANTEKLPTLPWYKRWFFALTGIGEYDSKTLAHAYYKALKIVPGLKFNNTEFEIDPLSTSDYYPARSSRPTLWAELKGLFKSLTRGLQKVLATFNQTFDAAYQKEQREAAESQAPRATGVDKASERTARATLTADNARDRAAPPSPHGKAAATASAATLIADGAAGSSPVFGSNPRAPTPQPAHAQAAPQHGAGVDDARTMRR